MNLRALVEAAEVAFAKYLQCPEDSYVCKENHLKEADRAMNEAVKLMKTKPGLIERIATNVSNRLQSK